MYLGLIENFLRTISKREIWVWFPHRLGEGHGESSVCVIALVIINWLIIRKTNIPSFPFYFCVYLFHNLKTKDSLKKSFFLSSYRNRGIYFAHHWQFGEIILKFWWKYKVVQIKIVPRGTKEHWDNTSNYFGDKL